MFLMLYIFIDTLYFSKRMNDDFIKKIMIKIKIYLMGCITTYRSYVYYFSFVQFIFI